jgi:hypothetical protein
MKSSISQIKNSLEILSCKLEQMENRMLGLEDKVDVFKKSHKDFKKIIKRNKEV